jgi:allantoin racemase
MKIIICRTNWADEETIEEHQRTSAPLVDADLKIVALQKGPDWTVCEYDAGLIAREMYEVAEEAEKDNYDAFVVGSCSDSNARGIKELISDMVIVEPGAAALSVASFIADKFSVLTVKEPGIRAMVMKSVQRLGVESKLASIRHVQSATEVVFPTDEEHRQHEARQMVEAAKKAVDEDGAEAVIFYSISYRERGVVEIAREMLDNEGYADLPLVDPACAALNYARLLVTCGLKQSKLTYGTPPTSARRKW